MRGRRGALSLPPVLILAPVTSLPGGASAELGSGESSNPAPSSFTCSTICSVSPKKGKPIVPGGKGRAELRSRLLTQYKSQSLIAARKSSSGSTKVQSALASSAGSPMARRDLPRHLPPPSAL